MLFPIGVLWMAASGEDNFERGSVAMLRDAKIRYQELTALDIGARWPQINLDGVNWAIYEPESGYLSARAACKYVVEEFMNAGGEYRQAAVLPDALESGRVREVVLSDQSTVTADHYVFACGPWLPRLFPETIGKRIVATKQDVFFFGAPAGAQMDDAHLPVWAEHRDRFRYGIPGNDGRGFKIADDTRGEEFDPTSGERLVSDDNLRAVREYMALRFPGMENAPLVETRVCQYEQTVDSHFIIDRHPKSENVWLLGGGSGHGFKHGPVIGEMMSTLVLNDGEPPTYFRLDRWRK
jgi:glycine/D-amino acid oxidase-like deaminating enzyme